VKNSPNIFWDVMRCSVVRGYELPLSSWWKSKPKNKYDEGRNERKFLISGVQYSKRLYGVTSQIIVLLKRNKIFSVTIENWLW
jgi:hypothetical protein